VFASRGGHKIRQKFHFGTLLDKLIAKTDVKSLIIKEFSYKWFKVKDLAETSKFLCNSLIPQDQGEGATGIHGLLLI
jgi:hypothetical protein